MNFRLKKRNKLDITLTPMIDVVFLLLIFFMVTTTFTQETQIKIKLPEAEGEARDEKTKIIALTIDADGVYYVNNHQVINQKLATLKKAVSWMWREIPERSLLLSVLMQKHHIKR